MQTPTIEAIETAIARADAMHGKYTCEPVQSVPGNFYVQLVADPNRCYIVDTRPGSQHCTCPQFKKAAVCKHGAYAHQIQRIAEEEALEAEWGSRFPLGCGPATHPVTGARFERIPLDRAEPRDW
jgi:hypothetical protein